jgi:hypothetical protein
MARSLVTSFVAALSEAESIDAGEIFGGLLVTMLVFWLALGLGVVAPLAWGFVIARASRLSALATLGSVALNGAFGLGIVALKLLVH